MDIQLKQHEIEEAVRAYVAEKVGINLNGKRLGQNFSMGRGVNALVVNLSITDSSETVIPGYTDRPADPEPVKTADVHTLPVSATEKADQPTEGADKLDDTVTKTVPAEDVAVAADTTAPTASTSLFNTAQ